MTKRPKNAFSCVISWEKGEIFLISRINCGCRKKRSEEKAEARIMMQLDKAVEEVRS